ncbi:MAG: ATP-binding cassette domain-containing protein, partial [Spirochaetaceae bacterium]|nr:ATP-binding cassette domain-containing protein [Spirochaetaceae bacterium]
ESVLGEKGQSLSGGERQRVGIARAIYQRSQILLMDECTSALDGKTEKIVMDNLVQYQKEANISILFIAHNLKTLTNTDRILFFDKGRLIEEGTFHSLINKDSLFSNLYKQKT